MSSWRERAAWTQIDRFVPLYRHVDGSLEWLEDPGVVIAIAHDLIEWWDGGNTGPYVGWDAAAGVLTLRTRRGDLVYEMIGYDLMRNSYFAVRREDSVAAA